MLHPSGGLLRTNKSSRISNASSKGHHVSPFEYHQHHKTNHHTSHAVLTSDVQRQFLMNWYGDFNDPTTKREFLAFHTQHVARWFLTVFTFCSTFCFFPLFLWYCAEYLSSSSTGKQGDSEKSVQTAALILMLLLQIIAILCMAVVVFSIPSNGCIVAAISRFNLMTSSVSPISANSMQARSYYCLKLDSNTLCQFANIGTLAIQCFLLIGFYHLLSTSFDHKDDDFSISLMSILVLLMPSLLFVSMPEISLSVQWGTTLLTLIVIVVIEGCLQRYYSLPVAFISCILHIPWIIDIQHQRVQSFLSTKPSPVNRPQGGESASGKSMRSGITTRYGALSIDAQAMEMRNMIGNVAHDLKTPLASFITGMDYIQFIVNDCQRNLIIDGHNYNISTEGMTMLKQYVSSIQSCLNSIRNTNSFMLMTINRCIDYAKASRGFKLVPKFESIDLAETLQLPFDCMRNLQDRIRIEMKPIAYSYGEDSDHDRQGHSKICSHIVTDKQWLQENILCLLSNAVKYSSKGTITIEVRRLHHFEDRMLLKELAGNLYENGENDTVASSMHKIEATQDSVDGPFFRSNLKPQRDYEDDDDRDEYEEPQQLSPNSSSFFLKQHESLRVTTRVMPLGCLSSDSDNPGDTTKVRDADEGLTVRRRAAANEQNDASFYLALHEKEKQSIIQEQPTLQIQELEEESVKFSVGRRGGKNCDASIGKDDITVKASNLMSSKPLSMSVTTTVASTTQSSHQQDYLLVEIEDSGIGMNDEAMKNLFNPFSQTQKYAGGTGLGLYSLAKRIEALRGHYGVKRRRDGEQGSLFWFTIPYKADIISASIAAENDEHRQKMIIGKKVDPIDEEEQVEEQNANKEVDVRLELEDKLPIGTHLRILVVDDSPTLLKMTKMMISRLGHDVIAVDSGAAAIELFCGVDEAINPIDLILMDMQMPVMDGFEATRRIRNMEKTLVLGNTESGSAAFSESHTQQQKAKSYTSKIVGMSAYSDAETLVMATESGMDLFIEKPFNAHVFNEMIVRQLFGDFP